MKDIYFSLLKKSIQSKSLNDEQLRYILSVFDEDVKEHYEEKIKQLESSLEIAKTEIKDLKINNNNLEIENESLNKKMDVIVETNKLLLHQLEERDRTTIKTLENIKENVSIGHQVIHNIQHSTNHFIEGNNKQRLLIENKKDEIH